jgi:pentatricopeptide repeat protein
MIKSLYKRMDYDGVIRLFQWLDTNSNAAGHDKNNIHSKLAPVPGLIAFDMLIRLYGRMGNTLMARKWLDEALGRGLIADARLFNSLISSCIMNNDFKGAEDAYNIMKAHDIPADIITSTLVFRAKQSNTNS